MLRKNLFSVAASFILAASVLFNAPGWAQEETNVEWLLEFAGEKHAEWETERAEAEAFAAEHSIPIRRELPDGTLIELQKIVNGIPLYYITLGTLNADAAVTTRTNKLWPGGGLGLSLTGSGYDKLGEWDGDAVRASHQEFGSPSRVTQGDGETTTHWHSTHVAGTLIAAGVVANAKGMAYQADLKAYDWNDDESEMATAAANGMELSNHSYGTISGWYQDDNGDWHWYGDTSVDQNESYYFGFYSSASQNGCIPIM